MSVCGKCGNQVREELPVCPRCAVDPSRDESFGGLLLDEELGRGGMGVVYRARDKKLGRTVAVKFLAPGLAHDAEVKARFEREAKVLAHLQHPNIVTLYDFAEEEGEAFLVMEYVDGASVASTQPMKPVDAVKVGIEVCKALAYAHARGVIHRDIKPENVLRAKGGQIKVTDFGIARLVDPLVRQATITATNVAVGTSGFMAPEVMSAAAPDARMDVYGVGALVRSLATGRPPVGEFSGVHEALTRIIRRAMAERPEDRFESMAELQRALESVVPWLDVAQLPPDERLWLRTVALLLTAAIGVLLWSVVRSLTPRILAPHEELPLATLGSELLPDGRIMSLARFETIPILTAVVSLALALVAYGFLRRHWRVERLDVPNPLPKIAESGIVFAIGCVACVLFAGRKTLELTGYVDVTKAGARSFVPLFGGLLEVLALYYFLIVVLESRRRSRPMAEEKLLLVGMALALVPPATDLLAVLLQRR